MKRLANPSQSQLIALSVLLLSVGAVFGPPLQVAAQPPEKATDMGTTQATGIPQPLATPFSSSSTPTDATFSGPSPRAIGTITGQGTTGYLSKFTGPNAIGNSILFENGGKIGLGTTTPGGLFSVKGTASNIYSIYGSGVGNVILGSSSGGVGIYGQHSNTTGDQSGVLGETSSTSANAAGMLGTSKASSAGAYSAGVRGVNLGRGTAGFGVYGIHAAAGIGVYGLSPSGNGVWGESTNGIGVHGRHTSTSGTTPAILGESNSVVANAVALQGVITSTQSGSSSMGVRGINNGTGSSSIGVYGSQAGSGYGVYGTAPSGYGVYGLALHGTGVVGEADDGNGISGISNSGTGLVGSSTSGDGVSGVGYNSGVSGTGHNYGVSGTGFVGVTGDGDSDSGYGVIGTGSTGVQGSGRIYGVYGTGNTGVYGGISTGGTYAGYFSGNVHVAGNLSKLSGSFKIDHPLHPATEYLSHSFVESPDMMNVYNGNTTTNAKGEAWVTLPNYFQALNRDFRYQLTPIGQFAQAIIGQEIQGTRFQIKTDKPHVKVSWQVTGIRNDVYARQHRIRVEETKARADRGKYLYPAGFGTSSDQQIGPGMPRLAAR
ncbi:hypothetical protein IAD21_04030 [Abditibacteriota bacterium]|nr:hypothetical protein IAD21_04030 [Abditibacteriota bacterium]